MNTLNWTGFYVIGDIHGRADLLNKLLKAIRKDASKHRSSRRVLITLGDYIDRGPNSKKVISKLIRLLPLRRFEKKYLRGNHEEMFLTFLKNPEEGVLWLENGGWATLLSYGFSMKELPDTLEDLVTVQKKIIKRMPAKHLAFLKSLKLHCQIGDYFFVHGGVRPKISLDQQTDEDLLWIRGEFLHSHENFGKIVVHGHSIVSKPEIHVNRIAVDTGAYYTGKLTCLVVNGEEKYFLQANEKSPIVSVIKSNC